MIGRILLVAALVIVAAVGAVVVYAVWDAAHHPLPVAN